MKDKDKKEGQVVTIYDVAAEAGVSLATVSRVINKSAVVREERRERVEAAIKKLNFKPNEIARGLARKKSTTIGVLVTDMNRPEVAELLSGIVDTSNLKQYDYTLQINSYLGDITTFKEQVDKLISSQVDGLLIMSDGVSAEMHEILKSIDVTSVLFGTPNTFSDLPSVSLNYQKVSTDIIDYIAEQGYQRAAIISRNTELLPGSLVDAFMQGSSQRDITVTQQVFKSDFDYAQAYRTLFEMYLKETLPPIVFATNDLLALAFSNVVQDLGKQIPTDVEIISFSNTQLALVGRPQITSVMYPVYRVGAYAMSMITKLIQGEAPHINTSLEDEYEIIWRGSTKGKGK